MRPSITLLGVPRGRYRRCIGSPGTVAIDDAKTTPLTAKSGAELYSGFHSRPPVLIFINVCQTSRKLYACLSVCALIHDIYIYITFFYINSKNIWFHENFRLPVFDRFTVLGCPEYDFTICGKCLSVCLCDKNFVVSVARELMNRIS